ncbi:LacI family transcriptional regulator [Gammaproteobacteria bacterium]|nr:LacI family transcriptional regulator [Gammaproteobacteria bacterium]
MKIKETETKSKIVRLKDIATLTGLSLATISKALNEKSGVSSINRAKVQNAVTELGFRRLPSSKLIKSSLINISVITYSFSAFGNTFYEKILRAMIEEGQKHDLIIDVNLLEMSENAGEITEKYLFRNGIPKAVIMLGIDDLAVLDKIAAINCPAILVNGIDPLMRFDSVSPDYYLGGFLATKHLLDLGHRDIIHIGAKRRITLDLRRQGFVSALNYAGIIYNPDSHLIDIGHQDMSNIDKQAIMQKLTQKNKNKVTAFFTVSDTVAMSLISTLSNNGFSVPDDISVIGFDDLSVSAYCVPALTTLHSKRTIMGKKVIHMLLERAAYPEKEVCRVNIGVDLVERDSTAIIHS